MIEGFDENVKPASQEQLAYALELLTKTVVMSISTDSLEKELARRKRTTG